MDKYEIAITNKAEQDMDGIDSYISENTSEPNIAANILAKIDEKILSSKEIPERNALVSDPYFAGKGLRKSLVANCIIFYAVNDQTKTVTIIRVLYGRSDYKNLL